MTCRESEFGITSARNISSLKALITL